MSSLSQEDLDAGWDDESEQSAAPKAESADAVSQSIPPNSITIEKSPAPLESPSPEPIAQTPDASSEPTVQSTEANLEQPGQPTESSPEPMVQPAESNLEQSGQPPESSSEPMAQTPESGLEQSEPPASGSVPITQPAPAEAPPSLDTRAEAESAHSQLELFTAVTEKPQLLADKGVDTRAEVEPAASEGAAEVVEVPVESKPAPSALRERDVPAGQDTPVSRESSIRPQESMDLGPDEPAAVEVAPRADTESYAIRHWRTIAIAAAAALFLLVGLLAIRSKHAQTTRAQPVALSKIGDIQSEHVAPAVVSNPASTAGAAAAVAKSAVPTEIGAPEPVRPTSATGVQAESFSDAFVKHAASVNSSWADVKKRPKAIDSSQMNKPNAASSAKGNDNPLDVLDKLEKARKAKKSATQ